VRRTPNASPVSPNRLRGRRGESPNGEAPPGERAGLRLRPRRPATGTSGAGLVPVRPAPRSGTASARGRPTRPCDPPARRSRAPAAGHHERRAEDPGGHGRDRLRRLTSRRWGVSMERRIRDLNRFTVGWTAYLHWPTPPARSPTSMSGCAAGCGRCAGRSGSATARGCATPGAGNPRAVRPANWPARTRATGGSHGPFSAPCPTPTGASTALQKFADPHRSFRDAERAARSGPACLVAWEGRGGAGPYPISASCRELPLRRETEPDAPFRVFAALVARRGLTPG
jgi:hypothetical protein